MMMMRSVARNVLNSRNISRIIPSVRCIDGFAIINGRIFSSAQPRPSHLHHPSPANPPSSQPPSETHPRRLISDISKIPIGTPVLLSGWLHSVRPSGPSRLFFSLRDSTGTMQCVINRDVDGFEGMREVVMGDCPVESVVEVWGSVAERPVKDQRVNADDDSWMGRYEIIARRIRLLNPATTLPFNPHSLPLPSEEFRLQHRYLDLRRPEMLENLRVRADVNFHAHQYFRGAGFMEVETPILFKRTPEGAREYTVPTDILDGDGNPLSYALPQSPQQFKQLLMASGIPRYYQLARCFRHEDLRSDRQPEFTQLDLEMAFPRGEEEVMGVVEGWVRAVVREWAGLEVYQVPRMEYREAIKRYGSDKPDIRYPFEIETIAEDGQSVLEAICLETLPPTLTDNISLLNIQLPPLSPEDQAHITDRFGSSAKHVYAVRRPVQCHEGQTQLGKIRVAVVRAVEAAGMGRMFRDDLVAGRGLLWVHSFPLLAPHTSEDPSDTRKYDSMHHPFTAPHPDDIPLLSTDPLSVRGQHYDLVWNGVEIGGGSLRIHSPHLQSRILSDVMGVGVHQFGHLMAALGSGCPPHGGFALGMDRFVAMLRGCKSIRDVIAFPKNGKGVDTCFGAPS